MLEALFGMVRIMMRGISRKGLEKAHFGVGVLFLTTLH